MNLTLDRPKGIEERDGVIGPAEDSVNDDARLVGDVRAGLPDAFERLYARYARMVHGILLSRIPHREVEDVVQDVFLAVHRRLSTLRDAAALGGWVAMIARNRAMDYLRRRQDADALPEDLEAADAGQGEAAAVLDAIRRLPEAYREPLILRLVEGMSGPEIAERTGLTPGSVRVNLHRGMSKLRESLQKGNLRD